MDEAVRALEAAARGEAPPHVASPNFTAAQVFSTSDVSEVIGNALERQAQTLGSAKLGFDDLLAVAAEVGIDPDSLREASRALRAQKQQAASLAPELRRRDAWLRSQRRNFLRHAGVYAIVNAGLLVLGFVLLPFTPWWLWCLPAVGWGVGLAIHALVALTANEDDFAEHEKSMQWWNESRRRAHDEQMAALQASGSAPARARIDVGGKGEPERLRFGTDTGAAREAA